MVKNCQKKLKKKVVSNLLFWLLLEIVKKKKNLKLYGTLSIKKVLIIFERERERFFFYNVCRRELYVDKEKKVS